MLKLRMIKSMWGMTGSTAEKLSRIAEAGYDGVEDGLPPPGQETEFRDLLAQHRLEYIPMIFTQGPDHRSSYASLVKRAAGFKPRVITAHSGRDSMDLSEQIDFFKFTQKADRDAGTGVVAHETHRGRALFTPWNTAQVLRELPDLRINADFSHWCCVAESLLEDCEAELALACQRAIHIHGRVGYAEGPQVSDPRLPEFSEALSQHQAWWKQILLQHQSRGESSLSFTPEFGPVPYMQALRYGPAEEARLWEICLWMADDFRKFFESESHAPAAARTLPRP